MDFIYFYRSSRQSGAKQGEEGESIVIVPLEERYKVKSLELNHYWNG